MKTAFAAVAVAVLAALAAPAMAQSSSATGSGSITVIRPLSITKAADLKFGTVVRPGTGSGSVVVSAAGARSVTGGVVGLTSGDAPAAAAFSVAGKAGSRFRSPSPPPSPWRTARTPWSSRRPTA